MNLLEGTFHPRSVAVIGASRDPLKAGGLCVQSLLQCGYQGPIYPVNPNCDEIFGLKTYPSIATVPPPVDLAIIVVPAPAVKEALLACGQAGVKGVVIITSGFKETERGNEMEEEISRVADQFGLKVIGPNTLGVINPTAHLNATFLPFLGKIPAGPVGVLSQSGGICSLILHAALNANLGISKAAALGNRCHVEFADLIDYLGQDPETKVIVLYLEGVENPRQLLAVARRVSKDKPVIAYKVKDSDTVNKAALSHTGTLAGNYQLYLAGFREAGILSCNNLEELLDAAKILAFLPPLQSNGVAVVSSQAGLGITFVSAAEQEGLTVARLQPATIQALDALLPSSLTFHGNPVDLAFNISDAQLIRQVITILMNDPNVNAVVLLSGFTDYTPSVLGAVESLVATGELKKPFVLVHDSPGRVVDQQIKEMEEKGIPVYPMPDRAARALAYLYRYNKIKERAQGSSLAGAPVEFTVDRTRVRAVFTQARQQGLKALAEPAAKEILAAAGIPVTSCKIVGSPEEAALVAGETGFPVVLKLVSSVVLHKSEVGGVKLGLNNVSEVQSAYRELASVARNLDPLARISVQPMAPPGVEVIVGVTTDPQFGPVIMYGLGGTTVELYQDVSFRLLPLDFREAKEMIREIKGFSLLAGYRGQPAVDQEALLNILMKTSALLTAYPEIKEMDLNPVILYPQGAVVVDARILRG